MPISTEGGVFGVKQAVKDLRSIDPEARKAFNREAKSIAAPIIAAAKSNYPTKYLSGMARSWTKRGRQLFPYSQAAAMRGLRFRIDTKKRNVSALLIEQRDTAASIVEFAGAGPGRGSTTGPKRTVFVNALTLYYGKSPRAVWPAADANESKVNAEMLALVERLMDDLNRNLVRG